MFRRRVALADRLPFFRDSRRRPRSRPSWRTYVGHVLQKLAREKSTGRAKLTTKLAMRIAAERAGGARGPQPPARGQRRDGYARDTPRRRGAHDRVRRASGRRAGCVADERALGRTRGLQDGGWVATKDGTGVCERQTRHTTVCNMRRDHLETHVVVPNAVLQMASLLS